MDFLYDLDLGYVNDLIDSTMGLSVIALITPIFLSIVRLMYYINSSLCIAELAKRKELGAVKAYIPFVREIFWHKAIEAPIWRAFFYDSWSILASIIMVIFSLIWIKAAVFFCILLLAYVGFAVYVRYIDRHHFTQIYIGGMGNQQKKHSFVTPHTVANAKISGISGQMKNQTFDISDGSEVVLGRDPQIANIVFNQYQTSISRRHCSVRYVASSDTYIVTNYSKNGVTYNNGLPISENDSRTVNHGTTISLGDGENKFFLS